MPERLRKARLNDPITIGWCELVDLPALGLNAMHAKIDTGARTSSLHATRIRLFERDGEEWIRFRSPRSAGHVPQDCEARLIDKRRVMSSNGAIQQRFIIETRMRLGPLEWRAQLSLANRGTMAFPILVGRRGLRRGFLIDSGKKWVLGKPPSGDI